MAKHAKRRSRRPDRVANKASRFQTGEVRIIGGEWRGRKLPVHSAEGLRPTSDRVRETLFNWLQFEIAGANCLDLFAGSGALGLEALSRGARQASFIEWNADSARQLEANLDTLGTDRGRVFHADALQWLLATPETAGMEPFDVVFLDPPFNQGLMQPALERLLANGWLRNEHSCLYLEQEKALAWPSLPENWVCSREKTTSQVRYALWRTEA